MHKNTLKRDTKLNFIERLFYYAVMCTWKRNYKHLLSEFSLTNSNIANFVVCSRNYRFIIRLFLILTLSTSIPFLTSCSILSYPNRLLGFSIEKFKNEKVGRSSAVFTIPKETCFAKSLHILKKLKATITHKNLKVGYIIAFELSKSFDCCLASTEVGIFITNIENGNVKVEIISNNSLLAKKFSTIFFEMLTD